jgi:hypothetical protein
MEESEGSEEEDSEQEEFVLMQQAVVEKDRGNEHFKVSHGHFVPFSLKRDS